MTRSIHTHNNPTVPVLLNALNSTATRRHTIAACACLLCWAGTGTSADAAPARSEVGVSLLVGFGKGGKVNDSTVNRYGTALGFRAGYTFRAPRLYLGGSFVHFAGDKDGSGEYRTSTLDLEAGYDLRLLGDLILIRPELLLGVAQPATIQSDNAGYPLALHWAPGLLAGVRLHPFQIYAEVRRDAVVGQWADSATFLLGAGMLF